MPRISNSIRTEAGFTIVELLIVLVIIGVLFGLSTVNLGKASNVASLTSTTDKVLADLRNEQILAMEGDSGSQSTQQPHGLYFQSASYTLFAGPSYNSGDTYNYTVNVNPVSLSTTFSGNQVVFDSGDGAISGYSPSNNTIRLTENGSSTTITINRFGATKVN